MTTIIIIMMISHLQYYHRHRHHHQQHQHYRHPFIKTMALSLVIIIIIIKIKILISSFYHIIFIAILIILGIIFVLILCVWYIIASCCPSLSQLEEAIKIQRNFVNETSKRRRRRKLRRNDIIDNDGSSILISQPRKRHAYNYYLSINSNRNCIPFSSFHCHHDNRHLEKSRCSKSKSKSKSKSRQVLLNFEANENLSSLEQSSLVPFMIYESPAQQQQQLETVTDIMANPYMYPPLIPNTKTQQSKFEVYNLETNSDDNNMAILSDTSLRFVQYQLSKQVKN